MFWVGGGDLADFGTVGGVFGDVEGLVGNGGSFVDVGDIDGDVCFGMESWGTVVSGSDL